MNLFGIGTGELLVIMLIALLVLGPERLPQFIRQVAKIWRDLRNVTDQFSQELNREFNLQELLREEPPKRPASPVEPAKRIAPPAGPPTRPAGPAVAPTSKPQDAAPPKPVAESKDHHPSQEIAAEEDINGQAEATAIEKPAESIHE